MGPLAAVKEQLGSVDSCPTRVITDMRHEEPNIRFSSRLGAFMYGNGVSVSDAAKLYTTCHATNVRLSSLRDSYVCMVYAVD